MAAGTNLNPNRTLRAAMTIAPPAVNECMRSQTNKTLDQIECDGPDGPGVAVELMQAIQTQLPYKISLHYVPGNDSWTDTLKSFSKNETDVSLNFFTQNEARSSQVDFTSPVIFVKMVIAHHSTLKGDELKFNLFYAPFDPVVWATLFGSAMIIALLFFVISRRHKCPCFPAGSRGMTNTTTFRRSIWKMVMAFVEKGTDDYYNVHGAERPLTFAWAFFLLIMQSIYNSSLIYQFLSLPTPPFSSIDDLYRQLKSNKIKYISDSPNSRFLSDVSSTKLPEYIKLKRFFDSNPPHYYPSDEMWERVASSDPTVTDDNSFTVNIQIRRYECNLSSTDNLIKSDLWYSYLLPKNSRYQRDFANAIMQARGLTARVEDKYKRPKCPQDSFTSKNVRVENVAGVCLVLALGSLLGIICLTAENLHYYLKHRYKFLTWGKQAHFNLPKPVGSRKRKAIIQELKPDQRKRSHTQQETSIILNGSNYIQKPHRKLVLNIECNDCGEVIDKLDTRVLELMMDTNPKLRQRYREFSEQAHQCDGSQDPVANGVVFTIDPPIINKNTNTNNYAGKYLSINKNVSAPVTPRTK